MILEFTERGLLPPGDYSMTFEELRSSLLVVGPGADVEPDWDADWRLHLVNQAEILADQLFQAGITEVFLDGSFVEQKAHPNDIDGYFECDLHDLATETLQRRLNALDLHKTWTHGILNPGGHTRATLRNSFRCGMRTGWSFIRMPLGLCPASEINMETSLRFPPPFVVSDLAMSRRASSRSLR